MCCTKLKVKSVSFVDMDMIELGRRDLHSGYLAYVNYIYTFAILCISVNHANRLCFLRQCDYDSTNVPSTSFRHLPTRVRPQQSFCFRAVPGSISQVGVTAWSYSPRSCTMPPIRRPLRRNGNRTPQYSNDPSVITPAMLTMMSLVPINIQANF